MNYSSRGSGGMIYTVISNKLLWNLENATCDDDWGAQLE